MIFKIASFCCGLCMSFCEWVVYFLCSVFTWSGQYVKCFTLKNHDFHHLDEFIFYPFFICVAWMGCDQGWDTARTKDAFPSSQSLRDHLSLLVFSSPGSFHPSVSLYMYRIHCLCVLKYRAENGYTNWNPKFICPWKFMIAISGYCF